MGISYLAVFKPFSDLLVARITLAPFSYKRKWCDPLVAPFVVVRSTARHFDLFEPGTSPFFLEQTLVETKGSPDNFSVACRLCTFANLRDSRNGRIWQNEPPWFLHHADLLFAGVSLEESAFLSQSCPEGAPPSWVGKESSRKCERLGVPPLNQKLRRVSCGSLPTSPMNRRRALRSDA